MYRHAQNNFDALRSMRRNLKVHFSTKYKVISMRDKHVQKNFVTSKVLIGLIFRAQGGSKEYEWIMYDGKNWEEEYFHLSYNYNFFYFASKFSNICDTVLFIDNIQSYSKRVAYVHFNCK